MAKNLALSLSQLRLDCSTLDGVVSPLGFKRRYDEKYRDRKVVKVERLHVGEDDGSKFSMFALIYILKSRKKMSTGRKVNLKDLFLSACSYPGNWDMKQITKSCKSQYKSREFLKAKICTRDPSSKYVVELYCKKAKK